MTDPIQLLQDARPDVPLLDPHARGRLRPDFSAQPPPPRRRAGRRPIVFAAALAMACAAVLALVLRPGDSSQDAMAAAVAKLANVAENQRRIDANGRNQYVVSLYRSRMSWTQELTQAKLDAYTRNQVESIELREAGGMGRTVFSDKLSRAERIRQQRNAERAQARIDARVRRGVKLSELPAQTIVATAATRNWAFRNRNGAGAAGGMLSPMEDGRTRYGSAAQARSAKILERAHIGGGFANLTSFGGFEAAASPTFDAAGPAVVKSLSSNPAELLDQLGRLEKDGLAPPGRKPDEDREIFSTIAAVVGSPYAEPAVRAAAIRLAAGMEGVVAAPATDERGRAGLGLTKPIRGGSKQLIFDQSDSRLLGTEIRVTDPTKYGGPHWFGAGKGRVRVIPLFDSGTISVSYDPWIVTRGEPVCHSTFCMRKVKPIENP